MLQKRKRSRLGINLRVLQEASDKQVLLFEWIKILSIFSSNPGELFRVRYPIIKVRADFKAKTRFNEQDKIFDYLKTRV